MAGFPGEEGRTIPQQPSLDLNGTSGAVRPLVTPKELSVQGTSLACIAERIAERHLIDRTRQYNGSQGSWQPVDLAWRRIADINPDYTKRIIALQKSMREARRGTDLAYFDPSEEPWDVVPDVALALDTFEEVENEGTRAVLRDVVMLHTFVDERDADIAEKVVEGELIVAFPDLAREEVGIETLPGVTPANIFQLIIEGRLYLPGSKIPQISPEKAIV